MLKKIINKFILHYIAKNIKPNHKMIVCYNDWLGANIIVNGCYERNELEILRKNFSDELKNSTFLDIGANIGNHTLFFCNFFNKIKSFEPQLRTFKILKLNTELYPNIEVFNFGIDVSEKNLTFHIPYSNSGMGSQYGKNIDTYSEEVKFMPINENTFDEVGYIKIDVEGNELKVIEGISGILKKNKPIISFELNQDREFRIELITLLKSNGYSDFYVSDKNVFPGNNRILNLFYGGPKKLVKISKTELVENKADYSLVTSFIESSKFKLNVK